MEEDLLIFLHIPKAGGLTFHNILERQFEKEDVFTLSGQNPDKSIDDLYRLSDSEKRKIKLVKGHLPFGIHNHLSQPVSYITFLRDPIKRVISHYFFLRDMVKDYPHSEIISRNMSLADYAKSNIFTQISNGQTRLIAGVQEPVISRQPKEISHDDLERAKNNLKKMSVIGLTEHYDESLLLMKKRFVWKNIFYAKTNVNRKKQYLEEIDEDTISIIKENNKFDIELYQYAETLFNRQIQNYKGNFSKDLKKYKKFNKILSPIYSLLNNKENFQNPKFLSYKIRKLIKSNF